MSEGLKNMDVWKENVQRDISEIKQKQQQNEEKLNTAVTDIHKLQVSDQLQDKEISSLKEDLAEIKEDTSWIRRRITGAIITATITAIVAGIIGVVIANVF